MGLHAACHLHKIVDRSHDTRDGSIDLDICVDIYLGKEAIANFAFHALRLELVSERFTFRSSSYMWPKSLRGCHHVYVYVAG